MRHMLRHAIVGGPDSVKAGIDALVAETGADELMMVTDVFDHAARLRSLQITSECGVA